MILDFALDNRIFLTDELDCAIQELDMLFNTTNTELIGNTDYGTNFEQFLWTLTPTTTALKQYVDNKIANTYFLKKFKPEVNVTTEPGDQRDIYYVTIKLDVKSDDEEIKKKSTRVYMLA